MSARIEELIFKGMIKDTSGFESITMDGVELQVEYDYHPEEPMVMYYADGSGHPGFPESIESIGVYYNGLDVTELYEDRMSEVEQAIWKMREDL